MGATEIQQQHIGREVQQPQHADTTMMMMKEPRRSSTTVALSESDFSSSSSAATFRGFKRVRFHEEEQAAIPLPPTVVIHQYPQAAYNAENPSNLFLSTQQQVQQSREIRTHAAQTWSCLGVAQGLRDIHHIPVQERIDRMVALPLETRGLEKELCPQFKQRSFQLKDRVVETVLEYQEQLRKQQQQHNQQLHNKNPDKIIAKAAMEMSHGARCMARVVALADQHYVRHCMEEEEEPQQQSRQPSLGPKSRSDSCLQDAMRQGDNDNNNSNNNDDSTRQEDVRRRPEGQHRRKKSSSSRSLSPRRISQSVFKLGHSVSKRVLKAGSLRGFPLESASKLSIPKDYELDKEGAASQL
ncbi:expressed unknown protein [Seminavis robusta]|uniref:Uncharacterized protein n=1 Tax=Seminavis robusta TaxID=568900 RepID=A0A9N8EYU8_9STRA|nr:expressed unknown protein [Seminavis robusta]|eukprot:Sro2338_g323890.1 n/a (355) ;mRNA; f:1711-2775